ncbi:hypothetical protein V6N12_011711 [Hibiscus sabdariffa]|uniref:Uncharacterized protein n=1 Tax=Hibiscus sabdariffa TaxID=183260 RepID=A0ABR2BUN0_9ROSI
MDDTGKVFISRNFIFDKHVFPYATKSSNSNSSSNFSSQPLHLVSPVPREQAGAYESPRSPETTHQYQDGSDQQSPKIEADESPIVQEGGSGATVSESRAADEQIIHSNSS